MLVEVAEARALPAAEGVVGEWHRNREIDADHADVHALGEIARGVAVAGEDGDAVAVFMVGGQAHRLLVILGAHHRKHRPENLLLVDRHMGLDLVEQAAADEVAVLVALQLEAAAVDHQLGAFLDAGVDIAAHLVEQLPGDHGAVVGLVVGGRPDPQGFDPRDQLLEQSVGGLLADRHRHRDRHAALAGRAVAGADQRIDRLVHVRIGHHDHVILGAAEALHALAVGGAGCVDVFRDRRGADEADRLDAAIVEQRVDRFLVAIDDVEDAGRQARLQEQLGDAHRHRGIALRWLEDEGVAAGDRRGAFPQRDHGREVERRDPGDHAERLAHGIEVDAGAGALAVFALEQMRDAAGKFHHLDTALHVAARIAEDLAVFGGQQLGEVLEILLHQLEELEHHARAPLRVGRRPAGLRGLGIGDGVLDLGMLGQSHPGLHLAGIGVEDVAEAPGQAFHFLAADEMADLTHGLVLRFAWPARTRRPGGLSLRLLQLFPGRSRGEPGPVEAAFSRSVSLYRLLTATV